MSNGVQNLGKRINTLQSRIKAEKKDARISAEQFDDIADTLDQNDEQQNVKTALKFLEDLEDFAGENGEFTFLFWFARVTLIRSFFPAALDEAISKTVDAEEDVEVGVGSLRELLSQGLRALADKILADPRKVNILEKQLEVAHNVYKQKQMELAEQKMKRSEDEDAPSFVSRKKRRLSGDL